MKRSQSRTRATSPTPTAFSGISNYKTDSYQPARDKAPAMPETNVKAVSRVHFEELSKYLAVYLAKASPSSRSAARQKLTRLTSQQFHELSTDVYDELVRRKNEDAMPFLPVKEEFHPKRNQARQKLATLPTSRFEDLSSDVYYELLRRYPEFKEEQNIDGGVSPGSNYDDAPSPDFQPSHNRAAPSKSSVRSRPSEDRPSDSGYGSSNRPSEDRRRPSEQFSVSSPPKSRRSDDPYAGMADSSPYSRRKPSQDVSRDHLRRPSASGTSDTTSTINGVSSTASSAMIIPNKSMMTEEVIQVPYGREQRESASTNDFGSRPASDHEGSNFAGPKSSLGGLDGIGARLGLDEDEEDEAIRGQSQDEYIDKISFGRASVSSDRSGGAGGSRPHTGRASALAEDSEKLRRDYEYKIATMQSQIQSLQRNLGDVDDVEARWRAAEARVRQLEQELEDFRVRAEEQGSAMRALQKELDDVIAARQRDKAYVEEQEEEINNLRDQVQALESGSGVGVGGEADSGMVNQLRSDMEGLFTDLHELQRQNDELVAAKDSEAQTIRNLDAQLKEYKRKYERAKTELRSVKATSQLYTQSPKQDRSDDELPVSQDGSILDIHMTAFLTAVDSLLTVGRSSAPSRVLAPMKSVVHAVSAIIEDVRSGEQRPSSASPDSDLNGLCSRAEATLSNLVAATKTHATSSGMSPVSLLDAAASHVSAVVTDMARTVLLRKATAAEQERFSVSASSVSANGFSPEFRNSGPRRSSSLRKSAHTQSPLSSRNNLVASPEGVGPTSGVRFAEQKGEDAWTELQPYLEAQTQSIVQAIQSVLTDVRAATPPAALDENITRTIAIVSSIVAVCNDNFPSTSEQEGKEILRELSDNANKLSEAQSQTEQTKESKQVIAKSSFAIANSMKALMKL